jgi:tRNA pseudouridine(38-40) synthase
VHYSLRPRLRPALLKESADIPFSLFLLHPLEQVKGAWDPRTNLGKRYRYTINLSRYSDPLLQSIEWHRPQPRDRPLDIRVMQLAAGALVGEGDFRGFTASLRGSVDDRSSSTCNLQRVDVEEREGGRIDLVVEGDRFLYHMVRLMAGALVSAGEGAVDPDQLAIAVQTGRSPVGKAGSPVRLCAPPEGLCLERVFFLPELDPFGGTMAEETLLDAAPPDDMLTRSDVDRFAASTASTGGG